MLISPSTTAISSSRPCTTQRRRTVASPVTRRNGVRTRQLSAPAVAVSVACGWAARAVTHALRAAGAEPVEAQHPCSIRHAAARPAGLVDDLSPWDRTAGERVGRYEGQTPILLYLPPTGVAFAALSHVPNLGEVRLQVQSRDGDSLAHLEQAVGGLVRDIPRVHIMTLLTEAMPTMSSAAFLFAHGALRVLGSGHVPTVGSVARALAVSPRTLQRTFTTDGLPAPKAFLDWLTLAYVHVVMGTGCVSMARAASESGLTSNELYRTRKRVARLLSRNGNPLGSVLRKVQARAHPFSAARNASRTDSTRSFSAQGLRRNWAAGANPAVSSNSFAE